MGADIGAEVALDTVFGNPLGNIDGNTAFFQSSAAEGEGSVGRIHKGGNGKLVSLLCIDGGKNLLLIFLENLGLCKIGLFLSLIDSGLPGGRNIDLGESVNSAVNGGMVHGDNLFALLAVGLGGGFLHKGDGLVGGDNLGKSKEGGL